jgi:anti-anti-sigma regulatory factor
MVNDPDFSDIGKGKSKPWTIWSWVRWLFVSPPPGGLRKTTQSSQIDGTTKEEVALEVTVMGKAAVVRFKCTNQFRFGMDPSQDLRDDLYALVDTDHYSLIVIDFENKDIPWLSAAFDAMLVNLHRRLTKANGVLKLCNVPEPIITQFKINHLIEFFNIDPTLESPIQSPS